MSEGKQLTFGDLSAYAVWRGAFQKESRLI